MKGGPGEEKPWSKRELQKEEALSELGREHLLENSLGKGMRRQ